MYGRTCLLDYEDFMTRYVPPPVVEREPEELFCMWTPTKQIRPQNPRDKGVSYLEPLVNDAQTYCSARQAASTHGSSTRTTTITSRKLGLTLHTAIRPL